MSTPGVTGDVAAGGIEQRSIDWIPESERHGRVEHLGAIWFVGNINLTAMATGVSALAVGAGLFWTIAATLLGTLFATFFVAFHSAQGPQLGLPQLIQSRAQFGYLGAALSVWVFALVNYVAFNTSDALLSGQAMNSVAHVSPSLGYFIAAGIAAVIALYGYDRIHQVNKLLTWPLIVIMCLLTAAALTNSALPTKAFEPESFNASAFMTVFVIVAGFQITWAPYVSDYSRYLPAKVGVRSTFLWTYLPSVISGIWVFALGAVMAAADPSADPVVVLKAAANRLFGGFGPIAVIALLVGLLSVMAMNQYGGMMSMISIRDSFRPVRPTRRARAFGIAVMFFLVWGIAQFVGVSRFNSFYANVLIFLAYLFTPWTAVNLVDYFWVRRGRYVIREMFVRDGLYGRWGWRGNLAYLIGFASMVPFMVTTPYTGVLARHLGSVDYSIFIGLPVAGLAYLVLARSIDLERERELVAREGILTQPH